MKRWQKYEKYLYSGLWHVHTSITDGNNTPEQLIEFAVEREYPLIGFIEHVRTELNYDYLTFYNTVHRIANEYGIKCVVGCEAKVLDVNGNLDVSESVLKTADVVYAAYHRGKFTNKTYVKSVCNMLKNPVVDVWAHPFRYAVDNNLDISESDLLNIHKKIFLSEVLFEINLSEINKYVARFDFSQIKRIIGYDLHNKDEF